MGRSEGQGGTGPGHTGPEAKARYLESCCKACSAGRRMKEAAGVEAGKGGSQEDGALGLGGVMETEERQWMDGFQTYFEGKVYRTRLSIRYKVSGGEGGQVTI